jgi:hypothetical protein
LRAGGNGAPALSVKAATSVPVTTGVAVSSIRSRLSAPKAAKLAVPAPEVLRRERPGGGVPTGLTRDKLLESQEEHRRKMEALGKPAPQCAPDTPRPHAITPRCPRPAYTPLRLCMASRLPDVPLPPHRPAVDDREERSPTRARCGPMNLRLSCRLGYCVLTAHYCANGCRCE